MLDIQRRENSIIIEKKVLFGDVEDASEYDKYIVLSKTITDDKFDVNSTLINFPGEYDIGKVFVVAIESKNGLMNYIIKQNNAKYSIIQNKMVLNHDDIEDSKYFVYFDNKITEKIDQMELDGEKMFVGETE